MLLERALMKIFTPRRLAIRDTARVYRAIATTKTRCQQGTWISVFTGIPEHDLDRILAMMESEQYIERDPGPFDQPWRRDRMAAWWAPGREWPTLKTRYQSRA